MLNIVCLNGGRGAASLIPALLRREGVNLTSIVNAYDDGKSTGDIRRFFGMLGPSDIRKVQALMLPENELPQARALFDFRYPPDAGHDAVLAELDRFAGGGDTLSGIALAGSGLEGPLRRFIDEFVRGLRVIERVLGRPFGFADCALMNCIYAGAFLACRRDMEQTTKTLDRLFRLRGTVLPNSVENKWLAALRENGEVLKSEAEIVELRSNVRIHSIYLLDQPLRAAEVARLSPDDQRHYLDRHHAAAVASPGVRLALEQADIVVYAAGTQHSSLYPTYLSRGIAETIAANRTALKIFVTNIGADYETPSYRASDYVFGAHKFLCLTEGRSHPFADLFSAVLVNNSRRKPDETYVDYDAESFEAVGNPQIVDDFESELSPGKHDGERVVSTIMRLHAEAAGAR